ncbi:MAG TPA: hypothetical protein VH208_10830, partial [Myxococcaceae bacterium]|nr:hypothetical protein [Myxococcaceae bacterium]
MRGAALVLLIPAVSGAQVSGDFVAYARRIDTAPVAAVPVFDRGRLKPADTLARETLLFLSGSATPAGLSPLQCYLAYIVYPANGGVELIDVRDPDVRERLGYPPGKRYFSVRELDEGGVVALARPLLALERGGEASASSLERGILEAYRQYALAREVASGEHFLQALDPRQGDRRAGRQLLLALRGPEASWAEPMSRMPRGSRALEMEGVWNRSHPSQWAAIACGLLGLLGLSGVTKRLRRGRIARLALAGASTASALAVVGALIVRGAILGFAPATTLVASLQWTALALIGAGVAVLLRYRSPSMWGLCMVGAGAALALPELFPRALSSA